jgi:4-hydroxy-tetrahydrodipicolinate synthase
MFKGSIPALITPFRGGAVDETAFQNIVAWQIDSGSHGLVPCGTTGESPTLNHAEHKRVVELCVEAAAGRVPVIAGTGSNSTAEAIDLTQYAEKAGADGALVVVPYYNKPTQEGLYQHFKAIQDAVGIPILIYNIPGRTSINMTTDTMMRLAALPNIVGVKDATSDIARISAMRMLLGSGFCQLSGEDATVLAVLAHGGHGCISVTANAAPALMVEFLDAWFDGRPGDALALQDKLMPLHTALFLETSPAPIKYAVSLLGKCSDEMRLPMVTLQEKTKKKIEVAMESAGLLG